MEILKDALRAIKHELGFGKKTITVSTEIMKELCRIVEHDVSKENYIHELETELMDLRERVGMLETDGYNQIYRNHISYKKRQRVYGIGYDKKGQAPNHYTRQRAEE